MKWIVLILCLSLSMAIKMTNDNLCKMECLKKSKVLGCFCDSECGNTNECCTLYLKGCENFFKNNNFATCCSDTQPNKCFCDEKCVENGDCCSDYNKCANHRLKPIARPNLGPQISIKYVNKS